MPSGLGSLPQEGTGKQKGTTQAVARGTSQQTPRTGRRKPGVSPVGKGQGTAIGSGKQACLWVPTACPLHPGRCQTQSAHSFAPVGGLEEGQTPSPGGRAPLSTPWQQKPQCVRWAHKPTSCPRSPDSAALPRTGRHLDTRREPRPLADGLKNILKYQIKYICLRKKK